MSDFAAMMFRVKQRIRKKRGKKHGRHGCICRDGTGFGINCPYPHLGVQTAASRKQPAKKLPRNRFLTLPA